MKQKKSASDTNNEISEKNNKIDGIGQQKFNKIIRKREVSYIEMHNKIFKNIIWTHLEKAYYEKKNSLKNWNFGK